MIRTGTAEALAAGVSGGQTREGADVPSAAETSARESFMVSI